MTPNVPDRLDALSRRRAACTPREDEVVSIVPAGVPIPVEGTDASYRFRGHDHVRHLLGEVHPGDVLVHVPGEPWCLYAPVPGADDAVWHGPTPRPEERAERAGLTLGRPLDELAHRVEGAPAVAYAGARDLLERPGAYGLHPEIVGNWRIDADASAELEDRIVGSRLVKDDVALDAMRRAVAASAAGHRAARAAARAGRTERQIARVLEHAFDDAGGEGTAYPSIVLAGRRSQILHGGPDDTEMQDGDLVLIDAGAEIDGYDADITRTFAVGGVASPETRAVHDVVRRVQAAVVRLVAPDVSTRMLHEAASRGLAEGLVELGLLRGRVDDLLAADAQTVFFPHGIGHFLGLATHDVGGYLRGAQRSSRPSLKYLRADRTLQPGMVMTIEPGLYFIDALLDDPEVRSERRAQVDFERAEAFRHVGGVRIEDDVLVTPTGHEVLGADLERDLGV
ncbi:MAG: aminopeptidase P N-terminal domain-containing protein [Planctomycetota bacterium]